MTEWGHGDDEEMAGQLRQALRQEADRVAVPGRFDELRQRAHQRRRPPWLVPVAAVMLLAVGFGVVWQLDLFRTAPTFATAGSGSDQAEAGRAKATQAAPTAPAATPTAPASGPASPSGTGSAMGTSSPTGTPPGTGAAVRTASGTSVGFATPSGNVVCLLGQGEALCQLMSASVWEQASPRACPVITGGTVAFRHDQGSIVADNTGARLVCGTQGLPILDIGAKDPSTAWFQPGRDQTVQTAYGTVPVLPYGGVATTTEGLRCDVSQTGVACSSQAGAAIRVSRESLTLVQPDRTVVRFLTVAQGALVTPSGGTSCLVGADSATCEVAGPTFTPPAKPAGCSLDWGQRIDVAAKGAGFVCAGDSIADLAATGRPETSWFDPAVGATVKLPGGGSGAVLGYGSTLSSAAYTCTVASSGVTCTANGATRGFVVSREAYRIVA